MRFLKRFWTPIAEGRVTIAIRRWDRPRVVAGRSYRTAGTIVAVDHVGAISEGQIDDRLAQKAGYDHAEELLRELADRPGANLYLIEFHVDPRPDPRAELAAHDRLTADDVAAISMRLDRLDRASTHGPWTRPVLAEIALNPGRRAPDLAARFGRETQVFKVDVRKLKNLGLTESLRIGYRLSPRGEAYLRLINSGER